MSHHHHICVCICTYKRPESLIQLLMCLEKQETESLFDYSIVIVDNDFTESAKKAVVSYREQSKLSINYFVQPEQNIALARNKTIEHSRGDFIAFIDDDELPTKKWLLNLYKTINYYKSDGALGPVLPYFEKQPPQWVIKGRLFDRPQYLTGYVLDWKNTRTGNALVRRDLFKNDQKWFDPALGSGGEDRDFFKRKIKAGHVFIWSNEAPVFESLPSIRWNRKIMIKRSLLRGKVAFERSSTKNFDVLKSVLAIFFYTLGLPFLSIFGKHIFLKFLLKICDHLGKVLASIGVDLVNEKYVVT